MTKMAIFKIFHNFPDTFKQIILRIIAITQKARLKRVVLYIPCKKSGKQLLNILTRSAWLSPKLKACTHIPTIEKGITKQNNPMNVKIFKSFGVKGFIYYS